MEIEKLFAMAVHCSGEIALESEKEIVKSGKKAITYLKDQTKSSDEFKQLVATSLIDWIEKKHPYQKCLDDINAEEEYAERSAMGIPPPDSLAITIKEKYGNVVVPLLAVRMARDGAAWPGWKVLEILRYLALIKDRRGVFPILRSLQWAKYDEHWYLAKKALVEIGDDNALEELEAEANYIERYKETIEKAVTQLDDKLSSDND